MTEVRPKTIFCDIDGTLIEQTTPHQTASEEFTPKLLSGTLEKLKEWDKKGYNIILTTGRKESTEKKGTRGYRESVSRGDETVGCVGSVCSPLWAFDQG